MTYYRIQTKVKDKPTIKSPFVFTKEEALEKIANARLHKLGKGFVMVEAKGFCPGEIYNEEFFSNPSLCSTQELEEIVLLLESKYKKEEVMPEFAPVSEFRTREHIDEWLRQRA